MKPGKQLKLLAQESTGRHLALSEIARRLFNYLRKYPVLLGLAFAVILLFAGLATVIPQFSRYIVDYAIPQNNISKLAQVSFILLILLILKSGLGFSQKFLVSLISERILHDLRCDLYSKIQRFSMGFLEGRRTGDLSQHLSRDTKLVMQFLSKILPDLTVDLLTFSVAATYLLINNWQLTSLLLLSWPLLAFVTQIFQVRLQYAYEQSYNQSLVYINHLQDTLLNVRLVKSFGNESYEIRKFEQNSQSYSQATLTATQLFSLYRSLVELINNLSPSVVLGFGALQVMSNDMTLGELTACLAYVRLLNQPARRLSQFSDSFQLALVAINRIFELLDSNHEVIDPKDATALKNPAGNITFKNIHFYYSNDNPVLQDFNLVIHPGTTVALVGVSGSGKSTVAKLAARFYEPISGEISIGHQDIRTCTLASLRQHIGIVSQETALLYGTIRDNIAYGKLNATDAEIELAAKAADAHDFITKLPDGYNSLVGEQGCFLSGGQRQRLSIARVILRNPKIIILDEATSALDAETEAAIHAMCNLKIGVTG